MAEANCLLTIDEVRNSFISAPPAIQKEIRDMSFTIPNFFVDLPAYETWPLGEGTTKTELDYKGSLPDIEQGFDKWGKIGGQVGCDPCDDTGCGYNITKLKSSGFQQRVISPMSRELVTDGFCIADIQTTLQYKKVFAKIIENIQRQVQVFKEYNIVFNYLTMIAKKYIVDSEGLKPNPEDPYIYRPLGTARISNLNPYILDEFWQWLSKMPGVEPLAYEDNMPLFGVAASAQVFNRMYLDNEKLRQDLRFGGAGMDMITRYNFVSKIGGQFIPVAIAYPRRFHLGAGGVPYVVPPWIGGIPANFGVYSDLNPNYVDSTYATHEEVLIFGKTPFTVYTMPTETDLGNGATFGPEPSYFDYWEFVNPQTVQDPLRRFGYFITSAKIALSATYSEGIYGLLVERPRATAIATFFPEPVCPPEEVTCDNAVPAVECPCPVVTGVSANLVSGSTYFITLTAPTTAEAGDDVQFAISTGGYITGTIEAVSADGYNVEVTFADGVDPTACDIVGIFCDNTLGCSATVVSYSTVAGDATRLDLILSNPIKADTAADTVTVYFGDGSSVDATIVGTPNQLTLTYRVDLGGTDYLDDTYGVAKVCVPPTQDASCPACDIVITQCS